MDECICTGGRPCYYCSTTGGTDETSEQGAYMEVMRVLDSPPYNEDGFTTHG